jgi:trehalose-phosphatase
VAGRAFEGIPERFWGRAAAAAARLLVLDYDGTLAPLGVDRAEARPLPASLEALRSIAGSGEPLAVVSGRPVLDLARLLGDLPAVLVGEHGWEERRPGGPVVRHPLAGAARSGLESAARAAAAAGWEPFLERKRTALMLHTRGMPAGRAAEAARACREAWRGPAEAGGLRLAEVNGGIEIRAAGRDKGTAVASLAGEAPPGAFMVYVGDDETDEDAFAAVRGRGFGVRVGPPGATSLAEGRLASCEEVSAFLAAWLDRGRASPGAGRRAAP